MFKKSVGAAFLLAVCLAAVSCKKLDSRDQTSTGPLALEPAKFSDAIPEEYGTLVAVVQNPQVPGWVGLWFQKPDKTIIAVFVNIEKGRIYEKTLTIPRK
jgi:hypothetical protein